MPEENELSFTDLRLGGIDAIGNVIQGKERLIITTRGRPLAVIVSLADLEALKSANKRKHSEEVANTRIYNEDSLGPSGMDVVVKYPDGKVQRGRAIACFMKGYFLFRTEIGAIKMRFSDVHVTKA